MFMCVVNLKSVNKLDLTWKQSFLILLLLYGYELRTLLYKQCLNMSTCHLDAFNLLFLYDNEHTTLL
jgi:hypothetical protein